MFIYNNHKSKVALFFIIVVVAIAGMCLTNTSWAAERVTIKSNDESHVFYVDVARTQPELEKGLMFVENMPENHGMIFLYNTPQSVKFWMKNTLIPLDMLFFDDQNILVHIEHQAQPYDETLRGPDNNQNICSVIELNGGQAKQYNIQTGAELFINFEHECLQSTM